VITAQQHGSNGSRRKAQELRGRVEPVGCCAGPKSVAGAEARQCRRWRTRTVGDHGYHASLNTRLPCVICLRATVRGPKMRDRISLLRDAPRLHAGPQMSLSNPREGSIFLGVRAAGPRRFVSPASVPPMDLAGEVEPCTVAKVGLVAPGLASGTAAGARNIPSNLTRSLQRVRPLYDPTPRRRPRPSSDPPQHSSASRRIDRSSSAISRRRRIARAV
jgi:hypothetical protein